jgi:hypothetical protein
MSGPISSRPSCLISRDIAFTSESRSFFSPRALVLAQHAELVSGYRVTLGLIAPGEIAVYGGDEKVFKWFSLTAKGDRR